MADAYMTNPDAQQGESTVRKSSRGPANFEAKVQPMVSPEDRVDEGPVPVPHHLTTASRAQTLREDSPRKESGGSMGDKIGRHTQ
jgi:hypothetical protein